MVDAVQLIVDVGNTRRKFAVLEQSCSGNSKVLPAQLPKCLGSFAFEADAPIDWALLRQFIHDGAKKFVRSLISGSHPARIDELENFWPKDFPSPRVIRKTAELPVFLDVESPEKVGLDRILNVMAVNQLRHPAHWAIIVDTGTATTIDVVSPSGAFQGGAILPGYELAAHSLHDYTHLLPLITMKEILKEQPPVIGRQTNQAVRSGLIWGQVGAVNEIVLRMADRLSETTQTAGEFYLTGGAAPLLEPHLKHPFKTFPQLTLQGLGSLE